MKLKDSIFGNDRLFMALESIIELNGPISRENFMKVHQLKAKDFLEIKDFLNSINIDLKVDIHDDEVCLYPIRNLPMVNISFTFLEWMGLQAYFPELEAYKDHLFHKGLMAKFRAIEFENKQFDIFKYLDDCCANQQNEEVCHIDNQEDILLIQNCLIEGDTLLIELAGQKKFEVFGHRLIYLDGKLSLVGEDAIDRTLIYFFVDELIKIEKIPHKQYLPNFGPLEINDFIFAIRSVAGSGQRIVLKIPRENDVNLNPKFHYMGNAFITENTRGDKIWAASVEVSEELFYWLSTIDGKFEILDPLSFKQEYEAYLAQIKYKKVS